MKNLRGEKRVTAAAGEDAGTRWRVPGGCHLPLRALRWDRARAARTHTRTRAGVKDVPRGDAHAQSGARPLALPPPAGACAARPGPGPARGGACAVRGARLPPFPLPGVLGSAERPASGHGGGGDDGSPVAGARPRLAPPRRRHGARRSSEGSGAAAAEVNSTPGHLPLTQPVPLRAAAFPCPRRPGGPLKGLAALSLLSWGRSGPRAGRPVGLRPGRCWVSVLNGVFLGLGCAPPSFRVI